MIMQDLVRIKNPVRIQAAARIQDRPI